MSHNAAEGPPAHPDDDWRHVAAYEARAVLQAALDAGSDAPAGAYPEVEKPSHPATQERAGEGPQVPCWEVAKRPCSPPSSAAAALKVSRVRTTAPPSLPTTGIPYRETLVSTGETVKFCRRAGTVFTMRCGRGHTCAKFVPCGMLDCDTCHEGAGRADKQGRHVGIVGRRRGSALFERIGGVDVARLVVTLPDAGDLPQATVAAVRVYVHDAVHQWARSVWGVLVGVHSYLHPAGSLDKWAWKPHFHLQIPLFGAVVRGGRIVRMGKLRGHVPKRALASLRALLALAYKAAGIEGVPQCKWKYTRRESKTKVLHGISYDARGFPQWYSGDLQRGLRIGRPTGLLAPRCKLDGIDEWRAAIRGEPPKVAQPKDLVSKVRMGLSCPCCADGGRDEPLSLGDVLPASAWQLQWGPIVDGYGYHPGSAEGSAAVEVGPECPDPPPGPVPVVDDSAYLDLPY